MRLRADWNFQKCRLCCVDCAVKNIVLRVDWNFQLMERNPNCTRYNLVTHIGGPS